MHIFYYICTNCPYNNYNIFGFYMNLHGPNGQRLQQYVWHTNAAHLEFPRNKIQTKGTEWL